MPSEAVIQRLKEIQKQLGVDDDGVLGPITLSAMELLIDKVYRPDIEEDETSLTVSRKGIDLLIQFEISSDAYYRRSYSHPERPGESSGVTIGIGYDLGYNTEKEIREDWRGWLAPGDLDLLASKAGLIKDEAEKAIPDVEHIDIPLLAAKAVFYSRTLSKYAARTKKAYPGIDQLPADAQAMLLSLVYNRGADMEGDRRREMKAIQPLVVAKDLKGIAGQIRAMKRIWANSRNSGLLKRRDQEAQMLENARTEYEPSEVLRV